MAQQHMTFHQNHVEAVRTDRTISMFFTQRKCLLRISYFMQDETKR